MNDTTDGQTDEAETSRYDLDGSIIALVVTTPDSLVVALSEGRLAGVDLTTNSSDVAFVPVHDGTLLSVVPDRRRGRLLCGCDDGAIRTASFEGCSTILARLGQRWIEHLLIDPSGEVLIASMGRKLFVVDLATHIARPLAELPSAPGSLALDPANHGFLAAHYGGISRWRFDALDRPAEQLDWKGAHLSVAASPDGRWIVSATQENSLHVWPLDGSEGLGMRGYAGKPLSLAWTADSSRLLTSGLDSLAVWRFEGEGPRGRDPELPGWGGGGLATCLALHATAPVAVVGFNNGAVIFLDLDDGHYGALELPGTASVSHVVWLADGSGVAIADEAGKLSIHRLPTEKDL